MRAPGRWAVVVGLGLSLTGCITGGMRYSPPAPAPAGGGAGNTRAIALPAESVWPAVVSYISESFFVLDNVLRDSRLVNLSFSAATPSDYVDCGRIASDVKNLSGARSYDFATASPFTQFEFTRGRGLFAAEARTTLSGKVNVILTEDSPTSTTVRVNTRYAVSFREVVTPAGGVPSAYTYDVALGTGESAPVAGSRFVCRASGALEQRILDGIVGKLQPGS